MNPATIDHNCIRAPRRGAKPKPRTQCHPKGSLGLCQTSPCQPASSVYNKDSEGGGTAQQSQVSETGIYAVGSRSIISIWPKAGDNCRSDFRDVGVVVVLLAPVNVGNMKFHNRSGEHLQGIENRD